MYTIVPSPLMSPYILRRFAVDPPGNDGAMMPVAKPPSALKLTVVTGLGLRGSGCDRVKHAVKVVADGIDTTWTVSAASPSSVVNHSPTNMPVVELTVAVTGTPGVQNVPAGVTIGTVSVTGPGNVTRPACPTSCCSSSVAPRTPLCISVRFQIVC